MKTSYSATTALAAILFLGAGTANAADCGTVTISSMNWQSAEFLASLDAAILGKAFDCQTEVIVGDTVPTVTSMIEKQEPDLVPEGWVDLLPEVIQNGVKEQKLVVMGDVLKDGGENGWWIPKYFADAHPEIKSIPDALNHPELFPSSEDPSKGAVYNGPQGWGATNITTQFFKAYGGEKKGFVLVDTGSSAGLDGTIAKAYERKEPWLGFYWAPTAILGKYEMVKLDFAAKEDLAEWKRCNTVPECEDPKPNVWPKDRVQTVVTKSFADRAGLDVAKYLKARSISNKDLNVVLAWMTDNQATGEQAAEHFLKTYPQLWTPWVSQAAAEKINGSLE